MGPWAATMAAAAAAAGMTTSPAGSGMRMTSDEARSCTAAAPTLPALNCLVPLSACRPGFLCLLSLPLALPPCSLVSGPCISSGAIPPPYSCFRSGMLQRAEASAPQAKWSRKCGISGRQCSEREARPPPRRRVSSMGVGGRVVQQRLRRPSTYAAR